MFKHNECTANLWSIRLKILKSLVALLFGYILDEFVNQPPPAGASPRLPFLADFKKKKLNLIFPYSQWFELKPAVLSDPVLADWGGEKGEPSGGIWAGTCQSQVEAEAAQRGSESGKEEGGGGWREKHTAAGLHQTVVWRDPAGTNTVYKNHLSL